MPHTCVVGLQWGDEAKGKIVDVLSEEHDVAIRYNGGPNAGHTIVWGGRTFRLSLLPTGILRPHLTSVIGNGAVIAPAKFLDEIDQLIAADIPVDENLALSDHAHVILPYHLEEEKLTESGNEAIGTTGRGIGPCYQDKVGRTFAVRVGELLHPDHLRQRLERIVPHKNRLLQGYPRPEPLPRFDAAKIADEYLGYAARMRPYITNTVKLLHNALKAGKRLLFEGAQGSLLDVDHGTYPYVTSSSSLPAGIWPGTGVSSRHLDRILGVAKAYTTRVGGGPFPTELNDGPEGIGERIRRVGKEYGTVTGRPRRVGWFDTVAVRATTQLADCDEVSLMLLDVLSGLEEVAICTAYQTPEGTMDRFPADAYQLEACTPIYERLPGWQEDLASARTWAALPGNAQRYVERIEELLGRRIGLISVGPDREQTVRR